MDPPCTIFDCIPISLSPHEPNRLKAVPCGESGAIRARVLLATLRCCCWRRPEQSRRYGHSPRSAHLVHTHHVAPNLQGIGRIADYSGDNPNKTNVDTKLGQKEQNACLVRGKPIPRGQADFRPIAEYRRCLIMATTVTCNRRCRGGYTSNETGRMLTSRMRRGQACCRRFAQGICSWWIAIPVVALFGGGSPQQKHANSPGSRELPSMGKPPRHTCVAAVAALSLLQESCAGNVDCCLCPTRLVPEGGSQTILSGVLPSPGVIMP